MVGKENKTGAAIPGDGSSFSKSALASEPDWQQMQTANFGDLIGPIDYKFSGDDAALFRFMAEDRHANRAGYVHGGMLMAFADHALGYTARRGDEKARQATVQFDMQFLQAVPIGRHVYMECTVVRRTRTLIFMRGTVSAEGQASATAQGVWKIIRSSSTET